jgi:RNA polymerase-associated protein LEO1
LRWSDGSLTLQLASDPTVQYEVASKALAPRQRNVSKPTPVSINDGKRGADTWNEKSESWTYLASASNASFMIRVTNKITASLQIMPSNDGAADEALERLQISMAASRAREGHIMKMDAVAEDPELAKKKAEQAEREKQRAIRRLEAQQIREKERASRMGGRGPRSGLTIGGLEDDDNGGRGAARAPRPKQRRKPRNDEYSDDEEEYYGRRRGREDDYDEEDDFIAASDEEEDRDAEGSDEEDMDAIMEAREKEQKKGARAGTPKRDRPRDTDADADGGHDSPVSRQKRRRVVEEDDDDE